jgi:hypothetical protein
LGSNLSKQVGRWVGSIYRQASRYNKKVGKYSKTPSPNPKKKKKKNKTKKWVGKEGRKHEKHF